MSLSNTSLPKPKNWQDIENHTCVLIACVLNDPSTQKNGRSGQKQNGVDIYGYRRDGCLVGVQCKLKYEEQVTAEELRTEVEKAKNFKPEIAEFRLITTAPRDQQIQESARLLTAELAKTDRPILVSVWGWEDIEGHASKHAEAWRAFDPTWNPFVEQGFEKLNLKIDDLTRSLERRRNETQSPSSSPTSVSLEGSNENTPRHGQITAFQRLIDAGDFQAALPQLMKLRSDEWAEASRSERYRILVGIASAKLRLGEFSDAGNLLLDAYGEFPEHKNARINRAKGYLLKNNYTEGAKLAREILADNPASSDAAGTLIQALIADNTCGDPLSDVPKGLHETEEVLVAHVHFLRCRSNPDWVELAKTATNLRSIPTIDY